MERLITWSENVLSLLGLSLCRLNVDMICQHGEQLILLGWFASKSTHSEIAVVNSGQSFGSVRGIFKFSRDDVKSRFSLSSDEQCFGFLLVVDEPCKPEDIKFKAGILTFPLCKQVYTCTSNLDEMIAHAGDDTEKAQAFLTNGGFDVDASGATIVRQPHRKLDKDLDRIKQRLDSFELHTQGYLQTCKETVLPEVHKIWKARVERKNNYSVKRFGQCSNPILSVIVPLYGRYDFMQHQIAHFSHDEAMRGVELIYVLDDPQLTHELNVASKGVFETFKLPFTVIFSSLNLGYAGANNLGVEVAQADHILLLNSDIIPTRSGWITDYLEQFKTLPDCGILGATLLYEDSTVQHVGMELYEDESFPGIWVNHHPCKGVPFSLLKLTGGCSEVQMTTGAAMLLKKSLFNELGGFERMYVLGDFEDSDLCLKAINAGKKIYVSHDVVLYHLERLSQNMLESGGWKYKLTIMNAVYQESRWRPLIERITA
ncbi:glycosyltransferase family 2 protein [Aestuariibacter salexigens]|uniref:glycosyltransferase family 2 protein n=1 Tax=Aestuariibacter salexigens TaxID=226010 RepID=UPI0012EC8598|nr:glycosyltransferase [Aestuariibacter salexigens]